MTTGMPDVSRRTPEPPAGAPGIQFNTLVSQQLAAAVLPLRVTRVSPLSHAFA